MTTPQKQFERLPRKIKDVYLVERIRSVSIGNSRIRVTLVTGVFDTWVFRPRQGWVKRNRDFTTERRISKMLTGRK